MKKVQNESLQVSDGQNLSEDQARKLVAMYESLLKEVSNQQGAVGAQNPEIAQKNRQIVQDTIAKYPDIKSVPEVEQAINAYLSDFSGGCLEQAGFPQAVEIINAVFKAGYDAGIGLKNSNSEIKNRMQTTAGKNGANSSSRVFTRADIAQMSPDDFSKYEADIFDQLSKGLVK